MKDKILALICFYTPYILTKIVNLDIFPEHIFSFAALVYGIMGSLVYTILDVFRRLKEFSENIEGLKPMNKYQVSLISIRIIGAGIFNIALYALILSYLKVMDNTNLEMAESKEGAILFGIIVGFLFEFIAGKDTMSVLLNTFKTVLRGAASKLMDNLKDK